MTGDTRLTAVFMEQGVGGWSPVCSLHPETGSHDLPRCSPPLDSIHVGAPHTFIKQISNYFLFPVWHGMVNSQSESVLVSWKTDPVCVC